MVKHTASAIGRGMYFAFWLLIFAILVFLFDIILGYRANPNQVVNTTIGDGTRTVVLNRNQQGHYRVIGAINGVAVTMLVDTGATTVALPQALAVQLGLPVGQSIIGSSANGYTLGYQTRLQNVQVGDISVQNLRAVVLPNMHGDVLLGMNFLRELSFTQQGGSLLLQQDIE